MKRRICAWTLTAALLLAVLPAPAQAAEKSFSKVRTYEDRFSDVTPSDWYYEDVKALYELGLTEGAGNGDIFDPDGQLTVAEVSAMASRLRSFYETGDSMPQGGVCPRRQGSGICPMSAISSLWRSSARSSRAVTTVRRPVGRWPTCWRALCRRSCSFR